MSEATTIEPGAAAVALTSDPDPAATNPTATPAATDPAAAPAALTLPGKDAKPEDWKAFYKTIGAPEKGDGYELTVPADGDPEFAKEGAAIMAEAGLLPHQAKALADWWNSKRTAALGAMTEAKTAAEASAAAARNAATATDEAALKNEWQAGYDKNVETAKRAVRQFFPSGKEADVLTAIEGALGYGATMRMMAKLGAGLGEGNARGITGTQGAESKSLAERLYPKST